MNGGKNGIVLNNKDGLCLDTGSHMDDSGSLCKSSVTLENESISQEMTVTGNQTNTVGEESRDIAKTMPDDMVCTYM